VAVIITALSVSCGSGVTTVVTENGSGGAMQQSETIQKEDVLWMAKIRHAPRRRSVIFPRGEGERIWPPLCCCCCCRCCMLGHVGGRIEQYDVTVPLSHIRCWPFKCFTLFAKPPFLQLSPKQVDISIYPSHPFSTFYNFIFLF
jgi:hypothetical protein